ncbi:MAG: glycosyltransferase family 39 protein [Candidatus Eremiobacter antarcticus]|nr:glycosyltransferase family 39 protein [Candidatus Eremiobacteraeota bacterium]MBC5808898.1 glycosyltransferase family 39 protein [Candidatus Eremiobacteraeota bacterium]
MRDSSRLKGAVDALRPYVPLIVAMAAGGVCRLWDLTGPSLFIDEGWVFHISAAAPKELLKLVAFTDFHPPLFYLITHYLVSWLHWPQWDYRYLTALFSLTGIAATWAIARRLFGDVAAAIAAFALAFQPALIEWDRLYRMYAVLVSLGAISWWLLLVAADEKTRRRWLWWLLYALCAVALPYVQYFGALIVLSQGLYAVTRWRQSWPALVAGSAAALALLPWLWAIKVQYPHGGMVIALSSAGFSWPTVIRSTVAYGLPASWMLNAHFDLAFSITAVAVLLGGVFLARKTVLPFYLLPIAIQVGASLLTGKDLVIPRYLYAYVPAFCLCIAVLAGSWLKTRYRIAGVALLLVYGSLAAVGIPNQLFVPYYQFPDWYEVNTLLLAHEQKNDLIVMDQGAEYWVVHNFSGFRTHQMDAPAIPPDITRSIRWLRGYPGRRVWYIENQPAFTDVGHRLQRDLEKSRPRAGAWIQRRVFAEDIVRIILYGRSYGKARSKSVVNTASP